MCGIQLREPGQTDVQSLSALGSQTFIQSYARALAHEQLTAYVARAFGAARIAQELKDPRLFYMMACDGELVCAYAKLVPSKLPPSLPLTQAIELKRLYVLPEYWGRGVGTRLMESLLNWAFEHDYPNLWLRVWEKNAQAIAFYRRWEFRHVGDEPYHVGSCSETVHLMVRP